MPQLPACFASQAQGFFQAVALDTETTGLQSDKDQIIEIGLKLFRFELPSGRITEVVESYSALQDPGFAISTEIQQVTGILPEQLVGQAIDWARVDGILGRAELLIAHNAQFDRGFLDRKSAVSPAKVWACSAWQVDWRAKGFRNARLQDLSAALGITHQAHRAMGDVEAMLALLGRQDELRGATYLSELLATASREVVYLWVEGRTFEQKDLLKLNGFRWNPAQKHWGKIVPATEAEQHAAAAQALGQGLLARTRFVPLEERFKSQGG